MLRRALVVASLAALAAVSTLGSGCAIKTLVANNVGGTLEDTRTAFYKETYVPHAKKAGPGLLMLLDGFLVSAPDNEELLVAAAEMNCSYALGMAEPEDPRWASRLYAKGRDYALRALGEESDEFTAALGGTHDELVKALDEEFDEDHVAALFWAGMCWGSWINVNMDDMTAVSDLSKAVAIMDRVLELDETYFHGGPHLFHGMIMASRPKIVGGDPVKGKAHFEKVFELTAERFLFANVLYAMTYAVQTQDRRLYIDTLKGVLAAPDDIEPDAMLFTAVAKERAGHLLGKVDDLFLPGEGDEPVAAPGEDDDELEGLLED